MTSLLDVASRTRWSRRELLGIGLGAFALPAVGRCDPARRPARGLILVLLEGGMSQLETWDPKPTAPAEIRGEFGTIQTSIPGLRIGEHLPHLARQVHCGNLLRAVHCDARNDHSPGLHLLLTGHENVAAGVALETSNFRQPSTGAVLAQQLGVANAAGVPRFVALPRATQLNGAVNYNGPSFLGAAYEAFETGDVSGSSQQPLPPPAGLVLAPGLSLDRLRDRHRLTTTLNRLRSDLDRQSATGQIDAQYQRALQVLTGRHMQEAFELQREPQAVRSDYGDHALGQSLLLARRLVEAGVTYVVVNTGCQASWDTHSDNFNQLKHRLLPPLDLGVAALLNDLDRRGQLDEVLVLVAGEMGRTPLVNASAGRDHWTSAYSVFLAGGGLTRGQILGETTADASYPHSRPVTVHDIWATLYDRLGVDWRVLQSDLDGRAVPILPEGRPIAELFA